MKLSMYLIGFIVLILGLNSGCQRSGLRPISENSVPTTAVAVVHFDFDRFQLKEDQKQFLVRQIQKWKGHNQLTLVLEGHADRVGEAPYNLELGARRALQVKWILVQEGFVPEQLVEVSLGQSRPLNDSNTPEERALNRRVELYLR